MGDNRGNSMDSRDPEVGIVKESDIMGKVVIRLLP
ncbi:S26 family signal peptidase, partial [Lawsonibacter sp. DFI.5.51]|nr:S26 family signal peptidase [Lawsonibacter sp. DFI.5.51]